MITSINDLYIIFINLLFGFFIHLSYTFFFYKTHKLNNFLEFFFWILIFIIYVKILDKLEIEFIYFHLLFLFLGTLISHLILKRQMKKKVKEFFFYFNYILKKVLHILKIISVPTPFIMLYKYIKEKLKKHKNKKNWKELF